MGRAPLHNVAEQAHISVMHQLGSSLHMISRYVKKSRSAIRSYLNNPSTTARRNLLEDQEKSFPAMNGTPFGSSSILQRASTTLVRSSIFLFASRQCTMQSQEVERLFDRT
uniref:HTH_Tnp_Tc3_1 domain-containing protein n=1 Tax=Caenorhabditis japonica TaxID=281687 RepID=A0A8R1DJN7_CAEJA